MSGTAIQRFTRGSKCPVCGGSDDDPRGQGTRCHGFISGDKKTIFCARQEHARECRFDQASNTYAHNASGPCPCGKEHAPADSAATWIIDCVYQYRDANGKVLHETVRYKNPKRFRQRRPLGNGKYEWALKGIEPVLYRLPEILAADPAKRVFVVEGEKDVDRLSRMGLIATCNPMGAKKWKPHYSDVLRDRHVVIIPDNDQDGRDHAQQVNQSLHGVAASVQIVELPGLPEKGDTSDFLDAGGTIEELSELAARAPAWTPPKGVSTPSGHQPAPGPAPSGKSRSESQAQALLRLASVSTLFRDPAGRAYASVLCDGHAEVYEIRSTSFRRWLTRQFFIEESRPPSTQALQDALGTLDAQAQFDINAREEPVFVRVAGDADRIFLDLGDPSWRVVRIDATGWCVISSPPVRFRRPAGLKALPIPERGGSIDRLKDFANIEAAEFLLLVAWLTAALRLSGSYPILVLIGEQGSAKSTLARLARRLIDPHVSLLRCEPREPRDLMIGAVNGWVVALDNLSTMFPWLSDALCRLATGGALATRTLYSNDEETFLDAVRPVILNGITDFVARGDLIDRCLFIHLPPIPEEKRRSESDFWKDLDAVAPRLFGALLDAVVGGLRELPKIRLASLPRMADFALFGEAVCRGLDRPAGEFLAAYRANRQAANESALEDSPVAAAVRELASQGPWKGTAAELLDELGRTSSGSPLVVTASGPGSRKSSDRWPRTPRGMSGAIRRLAPALRAVGINVTFGRDHDRYISIEKAAIPMGNGAQAQPKAAPKDCVGDTPTQQAQPTQAHDSLHKTRAGRNGQPEQTGAATGASNGLEMKAGVDCDGCDGRIPTLSAEPDPWSEEGEWTA
jgi:hypothetical protein